MKPIKLQKMLADYRTCYGCGRTISAVEYICPFCGYSEQGKK